MRGVKRIPQRQLRNEISDVLRRVEAGERFEITVAGRLVAELGPPGFRRGPGAPQTLTEIFARSPVDAAWAKDLRRMREEDRAAARDPGDEEGTRSTAVRRTRR